jgi:predicted Zn-ribbon and HTH transcriptional regulator
MEGVISTTMKTNNQIRRMLANRRSSGFEQGVIDDHRRHIEYQLLRQILELEEGQDVCRECATVSESGADWDDPGLCPDCSTGVQLRINAHDVGGMGVEES